MTQVNKPIISRLAESRERLVQQGTLFVEQTKDAGHSFITRTRSAVTSFAEETRHAGVACVEQTRSAGQALASGLRSEVATLRTPAEPRTEADPWRFRSIEGLWEGIRPALRRVDAAFGTRLGALDPASKSAEEPSEAAPVAGYESMNAKAAIALIEGLSKEDAEALLGYEKAHKNRGSVLRALEARLD